MGCRSKYITATFAAVTVTADLFTYLSTEPQFLSQTTHFEATGRFPSIH